MRTPPITATRRRVWSMGVSGSGVRPSGSDTVARNRCVMVSDPEGLTLPSLRRRAPEHLDVRLLLVGREVQRAAAERRKAGAEDHAGIDQVARSRRSSRRARARPRGSAARPARAPAAPARTCRRASRARPSPACRPSRRRSPRPTSCRACPPPPSGRAWSGRPAAGSRILPTWAQTSRPTVSASSIGPIGMPNVRAASSIFSLASPRSTPLHAPPSCRAPARG